ncbi:MAG TPA: hypothetical protein P5016_15870, partial [Verrucomicrobiales bacterium]|nr:hypothetical protein [Verrucomicrobiales bacterium]
MDAFPVYFLRERRPLNADSNFRIRHAMPRLEPFPKPDPCHPGYDSTLCFQKNGWHPFEQVGRQPHWSVTASRDKSGHHA